MGGIYIHVPFCKLACHYCDFHFSTNTALKADMVSAIVSELSLQHAYLGNEDIDTIYFGGGTPSLLEASDLGAIFGAIDKNFTISADPEITLEANPDDLGIIKLNELKSAGINRLSIGIQSFDDEVLKFLNRSHNAAAASKCFEDARSAGFRNLSIDLIYSIPGQTMETWQRNIRHALRLNPEHISTYSLTIESKTVFGNWFKRGKLTPITDEDSAEQMELLTDLLTGAGYVQYEISNFGKPGFFSRHNSSYWQGAKYLGVGPSAHSYNGACRQFNIRNNPLYVNAIRQDKIPFEVEKLSREDRINDYLMTTLRTMWGCNLDVLKKQFNYDLVADNGEYLSRLVDNKFADLEDNCLKLTRKGKLVADRISADLFLTNDPDGA